MDGSPFLTQGEGDLLDRCCVMIGTTKRKGVSQMYELEFVRGHVEVYFNGEFLFSADTRKEAEEEIEQLSA